jgi:hypothetical protein
MKTKKKLKTKIELQKNEKLEWVIATFPGGMLSSSWNFQIFGFVLNDFPDGRQSQLFKEYIKLYSFCCRTKYNESKGTMAVALYLLFHLSLCLRYWAISSASARCRIRHPTSILRLPIVDILQKTKIKIEEHKTELNYAAVRLWSREIFFWLSSWDAVKQTENYSTTRTSWMFHRHSSAFFFNCWCH